MALPIVGPVNDAAEHERLLGAVAVSAVLDLIAGTLAAARAGAPP